MVGQVVAPWMPDSWVAPSPSDPTAEGLQDRNLTDDLQLNSLMYTVDSEAVASGDRRW